MIKINTARDSGWGWGIWPQVTYIVGTFRSKMWGYAFPER